MKSDLFISKNKQPLHIGVMRNITQILVLAGCVNILHAAPPHALPQAPGSVENLKIKAPITRWDDALPLGNGLMGGLLWGEATKLRLSLYRGDLWDERTHGEKEWWKKYTYASAFVTRNGFHVNGDGSTPHFATSVSKVDTKFPPSAKTTPQPGFK